MTGSFSCLPIERKAGLYKTACSNRKMTIDKQLRQKIAESICYATGQPFTIEFLSGTSGGCINSAYIATGDNQGYFIKTNRYDAITMFEAERQALDEIAATNTIRVPVPVCTGQYNDQSWLVLEKLHLQSQGSQQQLGKQLAAMHRVTAPEYGWIRENTIGSTPQINTQSDSWIDFFRDRRLGYQLSLAAKNGCSRSLQKSGESLMEYISDFFDSYQPQASLLHGDLWGGNYAFMQTGEPVIFDPALYYGDRETDMAMTELFVGFSNTFRAAYENCWPLDSGYPIRKHLYNCYHVLNHFNLFGGGYALQAENLIHRLLSERNS